MYKKQMILLFVIVSAVVNSKQCHVIVLSVTLAITLPQNCSLASAVVTLVTITIISLNDTVHEILLVSEYV